MSHHTPATLKHFVFLSNTREAFCPLNTIAAERNILVKLPNGGINMRKSENDYNLAGSSEEGSKYTTNNNKGDNNYDMLMMMIEIYI